MNYLASLLGYGDCLITLSLLERVRPHAAQITLVGTEITKSVLQVIGNTVPLSTILFNDVAAFYAIRQFGITAAAREIMVFRRWAATTLSRTDVLILECSVLQNRLIIPRETCSVLQVHRIRSAYDDRERAFRRFFGELPLAPCAKSVRRAHRVVINPSARARSRRLPTYALEVVLQVAAEASAEVRLIDVDGSYQEYQSRVHEYLLRPTLLEAATALREADAYIGPDSFFMHLAYYFHIPFLAFFWPSNMYFAPPGMLVQGNFVLYPQAKNEVELSSKVRKLLMPSADQVQA